MSLDAVLAVETPEELAKLTPLGDEAPLLHDAVPSSSDPTAPPPFFQVDSVRFTCNTPIAREQPHHRAICYLSAAGHSNVEIAEMLGVSLPTVSNTRAQPWAQQLIAHFQHEKGGRLVEDVLKGAACDAARAVVAIARGEIAAKPEVRLKASNTLLDRLYGTAIQRQANVDVTELTDAELVARMSNGTN